MPDCVGGCPAQMRVVRWSGCRGSKEGGSQVQPGEKEVVQVRFCRSGDSHEGMVNLLVPYERNRQTDDEKREYEVTGINVEKILGGLDRLGPGVPMLMLECSLGGEEVCLTVEQARKGKNLLILGLQLSAEGRLVELAVGASELQVAVRQAMARK